MTSAFANSIPSDEETRSIWYEATCGRVELDINPQAVRQRDAARARAQIPPYISYLPRERTELLDSLYGSIE